MSQLDLLEWKPHVEIIPFPTDKRVGKVRSFVDQYVTRKTEDGRRRMWESTLCAMRVQMLRSGVSEPQINKQLIAFKHAVVDEINRRSSQQQPGGAA